MISLELQRGNPFVQQAPTERRYWWGGRGEGGERQKWRGRSLGSLSRHSPDSSTRNHPGVVNASYCTVVPICDKSFDFFSCPGIPVPSKQREAIPIIVHSSVIVCQSKKGRGASAPPCSTLIGYDVRSYEVRGSKRVACVCTVKRAEPQRCPAAALQAQLSAMPRCPPAPERGDSRDPVATLHSTYVLRATNRVLIAPRACESRSSDGRKPDGEPTNGVPLIHPATPLKLAKVTTQ